MTEESTFVDIGNAYAAHLESGDVVEYVVIV